MAMESGNNSSNKFVNFLTHSHAHTHSLSQCVCLHGVACRRFFLLQKLPRHEFVETNWGLVGWMKIWWKFFLSISFPTRKCGMEMLGQLSMRGKANWNFFVASPINVTTDLISFWCLSHRERHWHRAWMSRARSACICRSNSNMSATHSVSVVTGKWQPKHPAAQIRHFFAR